MPTQLFYNYYRYDVQGVQGEAGVQVLQARLSLQAEQDTHVLVHVHREGPLLVQEGRLPTPPADRDNLLS